MRRSIAIALSALATLAAGCGGGERQDADEPEGTFRVEVVDARFPADQRLAGQEELVVEVRNADTKRIPNVAVTLAPGFSARSERTDLAAPDRPVWIVDEGPTGGVTAYTNTWALGALEAGESKRFVWKVTPVRPGAHEVGWRVAAGLDGKARAEATAGGAPEGVFNVSISGKPAQAHVDPETGEVIRGPKELPDDPATGGSSPGE